MQHVVVGLVHPGAAPGARALGAAGCRLRARGAVGTLALEAGPTSPMGEHHPTGARMRSPANIERSGVAGCTGGPGGPGVIDVVAALSTASSCYFGNLGEVGVYVVARS